MADASAACRVFDRKRARSLPDDELAKQLLLDVLQGIIDPEVLDQAAKTLPAPPVFNATGPIDDPREREAMRLADILRALKDADFVPETAPAALGYEKALRLAAKGDFGRGARVFREWLRHTPIGARTAAGLVEKAQEAARSGERLTDSMSSVRSNRRERLRAMAIQVAMGHINRIKSADQRHKLPTREELVARVYRDLIKNVPGFIGPRGKPIRTLGAVRVWFYDTEPMRELDRLRCIYRE